MEVEVGREERRKASVGGYGVIYQARKTGKREEPIEAPLRTEKRSSQISPEKELAKSPSMESMPPQIMIWKHSVTFGKPLRIFFSFCFH